MKSFFLFVLFGISILSAQVQPSDAKEITKSLSSKALLQQQSIVKNIALKNIGPSIMSGRVVDLAVNNENPTEFYVAYATGGLWYTNNNGTTFEPVMDNSQTQNIGDIAVHWQSGTIYVGTGENNASRSTYAGIGILKSTDHGKTWENVGLTDSHHIGRIVINPNDPNEVVVGVTGICTPPIKKEVYTKLQTVEKHGKTPFL